MTVRTLLFIEFQVLLVVCIIGLFVWRYWYQPRQYQRQQASRIAAAQVAVTSQVSATATTSPGIQVTPQALPALGTQGANQSVASGQVSAQAGPLHSLLKNGDFSAGLANWGLWREAKARPETLRVVSFSTPQGVRYALRIENPFCAPIGVQQPVRVTSGTVYRLSAMVRSIAGHDTNVIFGGRVAFYLPPQREQEIVWMTEYNKWWRRELIFTNLVDGLATVYVHLGYGNVATTGEFTDIVLEKL